MKIFSASKKRPVISTEEKVEKSSKAQRFLSPSGTNFLPIFVIGTLGIQGLLFLQTTFNTIWIAKLSRKPAPTLVELLDGRSIQVGEKESLYRSPQSIKAFTSQILSMLFTASGTLPIDPMAPKSDLKLKLDEGIELKGNSMGGRNKVTTTAWQASFALSEDFRAKFLSELADITPPGVFSATTQTILVINYLSEPEEISDPQKPGTREWRVKMIANLETFTNGDRVSKAIPVNKDIYLRAIYVMPQPLPENTTEIQRAVYNARAAGLEIYRFGDLK